jgi:hypothetical protein
MSYNDMNNTGALMTTIQLNWSDFYDLMEKMKLGGEYQKFEKLLVDMFEKQFSTRVEIDWMD